MNVPETTEPIKLFLSHASEDKKEFVDPLKIKLREAGFDVWYDNDELTIGDSLLHEIGKGLNECDFGIVVLSHSFFRKKWPKSELDGLFALETDERKIILPVWKDVTEDDVTGFSPILAARLGSHGDRGIEAVVEDIVRAVQASNRLVEVSSSDQAANGLLEFDNIVAADQRAKDLEGSPEGARLAEEAVARIIKVIGDKVKDAESSAQLVKFRIISHTQELLNFKGGYALEIVIQFTKQIGTSVQGAELGFRVYQGGSNDPLKNLKFQPQFRPDGILKWRSIHDDELHTSNALAGFLFDETVAAFKDAHKRAEGRNPR